MGNDLISLPDGTRFRFYIAQLEKLSDVSYEITGYLPDQDMYQVRCRETGIRTWASRSAMRKVELPG